MAKAGAAVHAAVAAAALLVLAVLADQNFLLFHGLAEMISVGIAWGVFFIAWNARRFTDNGFFLSIGITYFYVGGLDLVHTLFYDGAGIASDGGNAATQLWLAARIVEAGMLVASVTMVGRPAPGGVLHAAAGGASLLLLLAIYTGIFPDAYRPGTGLTPFKVTVEFAVMGFFGLGAALLYRRRRSFDSTVVALLAASFALRVLSESAFTLYAGVYDAANVVGHLLKVAGFYLFYRATITATLARPYETMFRDLGTARKALEFHKERFRLAVLPAPVLLFSQGLDLRYDWVFAGGALRGRLPRLGQSDYELLARSDADALTEIKREVLRTGCGVRSEVRLGRRRKRSFDLTVVPLRDATGAIDGIVGTAIDVTELVKARAEAERAGEAKARFLAAASHDLRQPFQAMRLYHHMLASRLEDPTSRDLAVRLEEAMAAGENLLRALLDVSTLEAGMLEPRLEDFPVARVLDQITLEFEPQAAEKGLRFRVASSSAVVRSDPTLLTRIVRNLMANALRYTEFGGILLGCRRRGGGVDIVVCDTGIGIPPDQTDSIFDDFFQVGNAERDREKGLGLGLSVVARVCKLLDHRITVRSVPGRGSSFALRVQRAPRMEPRPQEAGCTDPDH